MSSSSSVQWNDFLNRFHGVLKNVYGIHIKELKIASLQSTVPLKRFDNLFFYQLILNEDNLKRNQEFLTMKFDQLIKEERGNISSDGGDGNTSIMISTLAKWLKHEKFHALVRFLYESRNPYKDIQSFENALLNPLWIEMDKGNDIFMQIVMKLLKSSREDEENKKNHYHKGLSKALNNNTNDILALVKRNSIFIWFLLLSFYNIHYIFHIWDTRETRDLLILHLEKGMSSATTTTSLLLPTTSGSLLKEPYPTSYLPFVIQDAVKITTMRPSNSTLYQNDMIHLLYYFVNPFDDTNQPYNSGSNKGGGDGLLNASRFDPSWNNINIRKIQESDVIRIISYLNRNIERKEGLLEEIS